MCQMISIQLPKSGAGTRTRTADLLITNQLLYQLSYASVCYLTQILERVRRIELLSSAWKAEVLPLHNTRMAEGVGVEPTLRLNT